MDCSLQLKKSSVSLGPACRPANIAAINISTTTTAPRRRAFAGEASVVCFWVGPLAARTHRNTSEKRYTTSQTVKGGPATKLNKAGNALHSNEVCAPLRHSIAMTNPDVPTTQSAAKPIPTFLIVLVFILPRFWFIGRISEWLARAVRRCTKPIGSVHARAGCTKISLDVFRSFYMIRA